MTPNPVHKGDYDVHMIQIGMVIIEVSIMLSRLTGSWREAEKSSKELRSRVLIRIIPLRGHVKLMMHEK